MDEEWVDPERIIASRPAPRFRNPPKQPLQPPPTQQDGKRRGGSASGGGAAGAGSNGGGAKEEGGEAEVVMPKTEYLVKWRGLDYKDCTWELDVELQDEQVRGGWWLIAVGGRCRWRARTQAMEPVVHDVCALSLSHTRTRVCECRT